MALRYSVVTVFFLLFSCFFGCLIGRRRGEGVGGRESWGGGTIIELGWVFACEHGLEDGKTRRVDMKSWHSGLRLFSCYPNQIS